MYSLPDVPQVFETFYNYISSLSGYEHIAIGYLSILWHIINNVYIARCFYSGVVASILVSSISQTHLYPYTS